MKCISVIILVVLMLIRPAYTQSFDFEKKQLQDLIVKTKYLIKRIHKKIRRIHNQKYKYRYTINLKHYDIKNIKILPNKITTKNENIVSHRNANIDDNSALQQNYKFLIPKKDIEEIKKVNNRILKAKKMRNSLEDGLKLYYGDDWRKKIYQNKEHVKNLQALLNIEYKNAQRIKVFLISNMIDNKNARNYYTIRYSKLLHDVELSRQQLDLALNEEQRNVGKIRYLQAVLKNRKYDVETFEQNFTSMVINNDPLGTTATEISKIQQRINQLNKEKSEIQKQIEDEQNKENPNQNKLEELNERLQNTKSEIVKNEATLTEIQNTGVIQENNDNADLESERKKELITKLNEAVEKEDIVRNDLVSTVIQDPNNDGKIDAAKQKFDEAKSEREKVADEVKKQYNDPFNNHNEGDSSQNNIPADSQNVNNPLDIFKKNLNFGKESPQETLNGSSKNDRPQNTSIPNSSGTESGYVNGNAKGSLTGTNGSKSIFDKAKEALSGLFRTKTSQKRLSQKLDDITPNNSKGQQGRGPNIIDKFATHSSSIPQSSTPKSESWLQGIKNFFSGGRGDTNSRQRTRQQKKLQKLEDQLKIFKVQEQIKEVQKKLKDQKTEVTPTVINAPEQENPKRETQYNDVAEQILQEKANQLDHDTSDTQNQAEAPYEEKADGPIVTTYKMSKVNNPFVTMDSKITTLDDIVDSNLEDIGVLQNDLDDLNNLKRRIMELESLLKNITDPSEREELQKDIDTAKRIYEDKESALKNKHGVSSGADVGEALTEKIDKKQGVVDKAVIAKAGIVGGPAAEQSARESIAKRDEENDKQKKKNLKDEIKRCEAIISNPKASNAERTKAIENKSRAELEKVKLNLKDKKAKIDSIKSELSNPDTTNERKQILLFDLENAIKEYNKLAEQYGQEPIQNTLAEEKIINDAGNSVKGLEEKSSPKDTESSTNSKTIDGNNQRSNTPVLLKDVEQEITAKAEMEKTQEEIDTKKKEIAETRAEQGRIESDINRSKSKIADIESDMKKLSNLEKRIMDCDTSNKSGQKKLLELTKQQMALQGTLAEKYSCDPSDLKNEMKSQLKVEKNNQKKLQNQRRTTSKTLNQLEQELSDMTTAQMAAVRTNSKVTKSTTHDQQEPITSHQIETNDTSKSNPTEIQEQESSDKQQKKRIVSLSDVEEEAKSTEKEDSKSNSSKVTLDDVEKTASEKSSKWDTVKEKLSNAGSAISTAAINVGAGISNAASSTKNFVTNNASTIATATGIAATVVAGAAVAGGVAAVASNWDDIKEKANDVKDAIGDNVSDIKSSIGEKITTVKDIVGGKVSDIKDSFTEKANSVKDVISDKVDDIKENVSESVNNVKEKLSDIKDNISDKVNDVKESISDKVEAAKNTVNNIKDIVSDKVNTVKEALSPIANAVKTVASSTAGLAGATLGLAGTAIATGSNLLASGADALNDKLSGNTNNTNAEELKNTSNNNVGGALLNLAGSALGLTGTAMAAGSGLFANITDGLSDKINALTNKINGTEVVNNDMLNPNTISSNMHNASGSNVKLGSKEIAQNADNIKQQLTETAKSILANKELTGRLEFQTDSKGNRINVAALLGTVAAGGVLSAADIDILNDPKIKSAIEVLENEYNVLGLVGKGIADVLNEGTKTVNDIKSEIETKAFLNSSSMDDSAKYKGQLKSIDFTIDGKTISMFDIVSKIADGSATPEEMKALASNNEALKIINQLDFNSGTNVGNFINNAFSKNGIEPSEEIYKAPTITENVGDNIVNKDGIQEEKVNIVEKDVSKVIKQYSDKADKILNTSVIGDCLKEIDKTQPEGVKITDLLTRISNGEKILQTEINVVIKDPGVINSIKDMEKLYGVSVIGLLTEYASKYDLVEPAKHATLANEKITLTEDYKTFGDISLKNILTCIEEGRVSDINPEHLQKLLDGTSNGLKSKVQEIEVKYDVKIIDALEQASSKLLEEKISNAKNTAVSISKSEIQEKLKEENTKIQSRNNEILDQYNKKVEEQKSVLKNVSGSINNILENHADLFDSVGYSSANKSALEDLSSMLDKLQRETDQDKREKLTSELHSFMEENHNLLVAVNQEFPGTVNMTLIKMNSTFEKEPILEQLKTEDEIEKEIRENSSPYDLNITVGKLNDDKVQIGVQESTLNDTKELLSAINDDKELTHQQEEKLKNLLSNKSELKVIEHSTGSAIIDHLENKYNQVKKLESEKQEFYKHINEIKEKETESTNSINKSFGYGKNGNQLFEKIKNIDFESSNRVNIKNLMEKIANSETVTKKEVDMILSDKELVEKIKNVEKEENVKIIDKLEKSVNNGVNYSISAKAKNINDKLTIEMSNSYFGGIDVKDIISKIENGEFSKINHDDLKILLTPASEGGLKDQLSAVEKELNINITDVIENANGIKISEKVEEFKTEKSKYQSLMKNDTEESSKHLERLENSPYNTQNILDKLSVEPKVNSYSENTKRMIEENNETKSRNKVKKKEYENAKDLQKKFVKSTVINLQSISEDTNNFTKDESSKLSEIVDALKELNDNGDIDDAKGKIGEFITTSPELVEKVEAIYGDKLGFENLYSNLNEIKEPEYEELHQIENLQSEGYDKDLLETKEKIKDIFEAEHSGKELSEEQKDFVKDLYQNNRELITEIENKYDVKIGDYFSYINSRIDENWNSKNINEANNSKPREAKFIDTTKKSIENISNQAKTLVTHEFTHDALKSLEKKYPTKISISKVLDKIKNGEEISKEVVNNIFADSTITSEMHNIENKTGVKILDMISEYASEYTTKPIRESAKSDLIKVSDGALHVYIGDTKIKDLLSDIASGNDISKYKEYIEELNSNEAKQKGLQLLETECGIDIKSKLEFVSNEIKTKELHVLHNNVQSAISSINKTAIDALLNSDHADINISKEEAVSVAEALNAIENGESLEKYKEAIRPLYESGRLESLDEKLGLPISECMKYVSMVDENTYRGNKVIVSEQIGMSDLVGKEKISRNDMLNRKENGIQENSSHPINNMITQFTDYINEKMELLNNKMKEVDKKIATFEEMKNSMQQEEIHTAEKDGGHTNIAVNEEEIKDERIPTEEAILGKEHKVDIHFEEKNGSSHEAARHGFKTNVKTQTFSQAS